MGDTCLCVPPRDERESNISHASCSENRHENQPILGFSIRVKNESGYGVKGYEFGLQKLEKFSPGHRITIEDVL